MTGQGQVGGALGDADVDSGATSLRSPIFDASSLTDPNISYWRWYSNNTGGVGGDDTMKVHLSNDGGVSWTLIETIGPTGPETSGGWIKSSRRIADFVAPTDSMRLRFLVSDLFLGSIVEAAIDDLVLVDHGCPTPVRLFSLSPAEGPLAGGNRVTLSGSDFEPGTTVSFGGTPALAVNFIDSWTLAARVPSSTYPAGNKQKRTVIPVDVTVSNPASDTLANGYRYVLEVRGP